VTPLDGLTYFFPPEDALLYARDGRVAIAYGDLPIPLLDEDHESLLEGDLPTYDSVGRGIYQALRLAPDCRFSDRYAHIIRDAYPHFLSELVTHLLMLDKKDLDPAYLDRKVAALKVLALLDPQDAGIPFAIGRCCLEKGTTLALAQDSTRNLAQAVVQFERALALGNPDRFLPALLAETCYLLGKYGRACDLWRDILQTGGGGEEPETWRRMLAAVEAGNLPRVAPVDYLEAAGFAFELHQQGEYEEAGAILSDILADDVFSAQFPLPQLHCLLGDCCRKLGYHQAMLDSYGRALQLDPECEAARHAFASQLPIGD
jgi:tetratricopeptide (TPR) repeat protein